MVYLNQMNKLSFTEAQYLGLYFKPNILHILSHLESLICIIFCGCSPIQFAYSLCHWDHTNFCYAAFKINLSSLVFKIF